MSDALRIPLRCPDWAFAGKVASSFHTRGTLHLAAPEPAPVGTDLEIDLELPDGSRTVLGCVVIGSVGAEEAAATGRRPGMDVRAQPWHAPELAALEARAARTAGPPPPVPPPRTPPPAPSPSATPPPAPSSSATPPPVPVAVRRQGGPAAQTTPPPVPVEALRPWGRATGTVARAVGIDFGTCYTSLSVAIGERVYVVPDREGRALTPSVVSFDDAGRTLVGVEARARLVSDPRRTIVSPKRLLGRSFGDAALAGHLQAAPFRTAAGPNDTIVVEIDGEQKAIAQICAAIIARVREEAEAQLGTSLRQAVLSMPVAFGAAQQGALRRAVQLAGFEVLGTVDEPAAGAMAYGIGRDRNEIVAVYDFGGGTFDFTVAEIRGNNFRILASEGDGWLGGDDFDLALANAVANGIWRHTQVDVRTRQVEWQRLLLACEKTKRELSVAPAAFVDVPHLLDKPKPLDFHQKLDALTFQRLTQDLFDRSLAVVRSALQAAGLEPRKIDQVVTTGGISRIPFVRHGLSLFFGRPITTLVHPEEAITLGAGLLAARKVSHLVTGAVSSH